MITRQYCHTQRGASLITALLVLSFLTVLEAALVTTARIDVLIANNFTTSAQLTYLAEAGLDQARENLRQSSSTTTTILTTLRGADNVLSTATDLPTLLATDDLPYIPSNSALKTKGEGMMDATGRIIGYYHVFLRNDPVDSLGSATDTNDTINILSVASIGSARKSIEILAKKGSFPQVPSALTLDGPMPSFNAPNSGNFFVKGIDFGGGATQSSIGVIVQTPDVATVTNAIPNNLKGNYEGAGPNSIPSVNNVDPTMAAQLKTVGGLEQTVADLAAVANATYNPACGQQQSVSTPVGSSTNPQIVVVNGDASFSGNSIGYGTLIVRGKLSLSGNFSWYGLILIVGQGDLDWSGGGNGEVQGGIFIARTRDNDRSCSNPPNPLGTLRSTRGVVTANFNGGGGNGITLNTARINAGTNKLPYTPLSYREY